VRSNEVFFHFTDSEIGYKTFSDNAWERAIIFTFPVQTNDNADLSARRNLLSTV
jgi:hypothetical protein